MKDTWAPSFGATTQSHLRRFSENAALLRCASTTLTAPPASAPTAANVSVMPLQVSRTAHDVRLVQSAQDHSVLSKTAKAKRRIELISSW
jgi:hypothetical protein